MVRVEEFGGLQTPRTTLVASMPTEHITNHTVETLATNYGPKVAIVGGVSSVVGGLSLTDLLAIGGFALALVGTVATVFFGWRKDRRETMEHLERIRLIELQRQEALETGKDASDSRNA